MIRVIEANFNNEGRVAVDNEEFIISLMIGEIKWVQDLTKTVGRGLSEQVSIYIFTISQYIFFLRKFIILLIFVVVVLPLDINSDKNHIVSFTIQYTN